MKRAFSTLACLNATVDEVIGYAVRNHIEGVELRLDATQKICGEDPSRAEEIRKEFEAAGVRIVDLASGVTAASYDEKQLALGYSVAALAEAVGARAVRVFLGTNVSNFSMQPPHDFDGIVRFLRALCREAAKHNIEIWAETHSEFSTAQSVRDVIDAVGEDNLYAIWDVIHTMEYREGLADSVRVLGDRLAHVHFKDGRFSGDYDRTAYIHTRLGEGEMPFGSVLALLKESGFDGYLSLEWEQPWRPEIQHCYPDTDALLSHYNEILDREEQNLLPCLASGLWKTEVPAVKALASFDTGIFLDTLNIRLSSNTFGIGKWVADAPAEEGKTYRFSVVCKTEETENDVYVILTQLRADGTWIIREHAHSAIRDGAYLRFSDCVKAETGAVSVKVELWLKGRYAECAFYAPHLTPCAPPPARKITAAVAYIKPAYTKETTLATNEADLTAAVDAAGAYHPDIIVLGECMRGRCVDLPFSEKLETENSPFVSVMREKARQYHSYLIYNFHERDGAEIYNTSLLLDRNGKTVGKYRKTHLTVTELELGITPGTGYPVFDTDFGRVGMLICFDQYFSATMEAVAANGAELVCISTAGDGAEKTAARALDAGVWLAVCGMNTENDHNWGAGRIVNPDGKIIAQTGESLHPAVCEIDLDARVRRHWLSLGPADSESYGVYRYEKNPKSFG